MIFESRLCKHRKGGGRGILSSQQSPGACHLAPRMSTAGVFWGVKNTAHSTKWRVTSADSYTPTDSSNKYFQNLIQTWRSQLYRSHKLKEPRSSSGKIENSRFIWWGKVSSPPPPQVSNLHIVFKAFSLNISYIKVSPPQHTHTHCKNFNFQLFPEKLGKLTAIDTHFHRNHSSLALFHLFVVLTWFL